MSKEGSKDDQHGTYRVPTVGKVMWVHLVDLSLKTVISDLIVVRLGWPDRVSGDAREDGLTHSIKDLNVERCRSGGLGNKTAPQ